MIRASAIGILACVALLAQACATDGVAPAPGGGFSSPCAVSAVTGATVRADGPSVTLNGQPLHATCPLSQGDTVVTHAGSTATIRFQDGTTIVIPENTDPTANWTPPSGNQKGVIRLRIDEGLALIATGAQYAVDWVTGLGQGLYLSRGVVETHAGRTTAYLFDGHMNLQRPSFRALAPMQAVDITSGGAVQVRPISPAEMTRFSRMFGRYVAAPAQVTASPPRTVPPPKPVPPPPIPRPRIPKAQQPPPVVVQ